MLHTNYYKNKKSVRLNLNKFFKRISLKKQYIKELKNKIVMINHIKKNNYKVLNTQLLENSYGLSKKKVSEVSYIIDFSFSRTNTVIHVMDCVGNTKFCYSAGLFKVKGKQKVFQSDILLNKFYKILVNDLLFLKGSPLAIHFKNKNASNRISWFIRKLKKKFFIVVVKFFASHPYNGCRKKKIRRKKFKIIKRRHG